MNTCIISQSLIKILRKLNHEIALNNFIALELIVFKETHSININSKHFSHTFRS